MARAKGTPIEKWFGQTFITREMDIHLSTEFAQVLRRASHATDGLSSMVAWLLVLHDHTSFSSLKS
jgi:hypothetical protein